MTAIRLAQLREWLGVAGCEALILPSTDAFVSEFAPPAERRLRWATGFTGSTATAVIGRNAAALFVDGRYSLQARRECGAVMAIEGATPGERRAWIRRHLAPGAQLAIDPRLHGVADYEAWESIAAQASVRIRPIVGEHPVDGLWRADRPHAQSPRVETFALEVAGLTARDKCAALAAHVRNRGASAMLVADPEDVSWALNLRVAGETIRTAVGDWHVVPSVRSHLLVEPEGAIGWYIDACAFEPGLPDLAGIDREPIGRLRTRLGELARAGRIIGDPRRTPAALLSLETGLSRIEMVADDAAARRRWIKYPCEIAAARNAHRLDALALVRFMAWLESALAEGPVTEWDAAARLEALRAEHPAYRGASMPLMSAAGPSGALPHYVPERTDCLTINDHVLYWMDSGGHYEGGTTDNTITLATGNPAPRHRRAHTQVLRGLMALSRARFPVGTMAYQLDPIARGPMWDAGFDYAHNTGHGVGNRLNIHEGPLIGRHPGPTTSVALEPGMIVSNEPGYYAEGDFGVRLETHMLVREANDEGFLDFETISRLPIDARLVDMAALTADERRWLAAYHRNIVADLETDLDRASRSWLSNFAAPYFK